MRISILLACGDADFARRIESALASSGHTFSTVDRAGAALELLRSGQVELVLLAAPLPDARPMQVLTHIRTGRMTANLPVVVLGERDDELERMVALELGADEYLPKAATGRELLLRVNALARRARPLPPVGDPREQYGLLELDRTGFRVWVDGQPRDLTAGEFRLLVALATPAGTVHPRVRLREALEPGERSEGDRFIDARVARLRERLGDAGSQIVTVRGVGYRLDTRVPATGGRSAGA